MKKKMVKKSHGILGMNDLAEPSGVRPGLFQQPSASPPPTSSGPQNQSGYSPTAVTRNMAATSPSPALGTFGSRPMASSGNRIGSGNVNQAGSMASSPSRVQLGGRLDTGTGSVSSLSRNQNRDAAMGLLKDTAPARPAGQAPVRTSRMTGVAGARNNSVQGQANIRAKTGLNLRAGTDMSGVMGSLPRMPEMNTRVNQSTAGSSAANRRMGTSGFAGTSKKAHGFDAGGGFGNPYNEMASAKKQPSSRVGVRNVGFSPATATGPQAQPVSSGGPGAALSPMAPAARRPRALTAGQSDRNAAYNARNPTRTQLRVNASTSTPGPRAITAPMGPVGQAPAGGRYNEATQTSRVAPVSRGSVMTAANDPSESVASPAARPARPVAATPAAPRANAGTGIGMDRYSRGFAGYGSTSHGYGRSNVKLMDDEDC